jgi:PTH1 family peptidyl-tRNA hydrolase
MGSVRGAANFRLSRDCTPTARDVDVGGQPRRAGPREASVLQFGAGPSGRIRALFPSRGDPLKVVIGLGNPGDQYRETRHNVGWMVLDRLADRAGWVGKGRTKDASSVVGGRFRSLDLLLVKPLTFMNESGIAVRKVLARERAPLTEMLVVVDDFALPFGKLRFREGGGPGGHNGLKSIIGELESEAFSRLRVGIGAPDGRFIDHVLTKFEPDERQRLDELLDAAADAVEAWSREGTNKAATRFNAFELRPADQDLIAPPGAVDGPAGPDGIRRTKTGWRKIRAKSDSADDGDRG